MTDVQTLDRVVIRFAGDSGDGMQLTGERFTADSAVVGNDFATLPNCPAEIRAPQGTIAGVSSFQLHFANSDIRTPGDRPDVLVAMNPAALKANFDDLKRGGVLIADTAEFTRRNLARVGYAVNPLDDGLLTDYQVHRVDLTGLTMACLAEFDLGRKEASRAKNMFALGLLTWLYTRPAEHTLNLLDARFAASPKLRDSNKAAFLAGHAYGETTESFAVRYEVGAAPVPAGTYRQVSGNKALALGLMAGAVKAGLPLFLGAYPITPASDVLHELSKATDQGVTTFQAEDEIAAAGAALGASYAGALGVTSTSGPGLALKSETISLAVMLEQPLVVCDIQRAGPSTGMPTKTEQADLSQALYGRHGEAPVPVLAAQSPADCFATAVEAVRIALVYRTPVSVLSDSYLATGAEPNGPDGSFWPYARDERLARALALPGTPGLEHRIGGLEKADGSGEISYAPDNHDLMVRLRQAKVDGIVADVPDLVVDDPSGEAEVLVLGWGSSWGPIGAAARRVREAGRLIAITHLRHLNPLPANTGDVLGAYRRVVVPEMNLGQLAALLRAKYLVDVRSFARVRGLPISAAELAAHLNDVIDRKDAQ